MVIRISLTIIILLCCWGLLGCSQTRTIRGERLPSDASGQRLHAPDGPAAAQALSDGISLFRSGEMESAEGHFRKARSVDPDNWLAPYYLGLIALHNRLWAQADEELHQALQLASDDTRTRCRIYLGLGQIAEAQGQAATARLAYLTALNLWPNSSPARDALARLERRDQPPSDSP